MVELCNLIVHQKILQSQTFVYNLQTKVDTVFLSSLTSSPLHTLTSKVDIVSDLSPDSLVITAVVIELSTNNSLQQLFSLSQKRIR